MERSIAKRVFLGIGAVLAVVAFLFLVLMVGQRELQLDSLTHREACLIASKLGFDTSRERTFDFCGFRGSTRDSKASIEACEEEAVLQQELQGQGYTYFGRTSDNLLGNVREEYLLSVDTDFELFFAAQDPADDPASSDLYRKMLRTGGYDKELYSRSGFMEVCMYKSSDALLFFGKDLDRCQTYLVYALPAVQMHGDEHPSSHDLLKAPLGSESGTKDTLDWANGMFVLGREWTCQ